MAWDSPASSGVSGDLGQRGEVRSMFPKTYGISLAWNAWMPA